MVPVKDVQAVPRIQTAAEAIFGDGSFRFSDGGEAYRELSHRLSEYTGIPVGVFNLGDLPYAYKNPHMIPPIGQNAFTPKQIRHRIRTLYKRASETFGAQNQAVLRQFNLVSIARCASQTAVTLSAKANQGTVWGSLPPRMDGDYMANAAIILMPDRDWSDKTKWAYLAGLREEHIVEYPKGEGIDVITLGHELGHLVQRNDKNIGNVAFRGSDDGGAVKHYAYDAGKVMGSKERSWRYENDADKAGDDMAAAVVADPRLSSSLEMSIREARAVMPLARAVARFGYSPEYYGIGLALRRHQQGLETLPFARHCEAQDELLLRVMERRLGLRAVGGELLSRNSTSEIIHNTTNAYRLGLLRDLSLLGTISAACDGPKEADQRVPLLHTLVDVVRDEPITDPLVFQEAALIFEAAQYFNPSIFDGLPVVDAVKLCSKALSPPEGGGKPDTPRQKLPLLPPGELLHS